MSSVSLFGDSLRVVIPCKPVRSCAGTQGIKPTLVDGVTALERLQPLMADRQNKAVAELMRGEEGQFFIDKMVELAHLVDAMPVTYQQQDEKDPVAYLHYFYGGSDWYITEKDVEGEVHQAYGFACLNGDMMNAEYGYISIAELAAVKLQFGMTVDLDFHFEPTRMSLVKQGLEAKNG
jgi:hypothetical protein